MMTTEHDEALVERVALALARTVDTEIPDDWAKYGMARGRWMDKARAVIYPPAPPKTRMQVARELLADAYEATSFSSDAMAAEQAMKGTYDGGIAMKAIIAALALPAMED